MCTFLILFLLSLSQAFGLRCFDCDSKTHPGVCNDQGNLTEQHTNHTEEDCRGSCFVGTLWNKMEEVHLRYCVKSNNQNGCEKTEDGFICQCSTDLCNKDLSTCRKTSRCTQTIQESVPSDLKTKASSEEPDRINRSIINFGTVIGCLVGAVAILMVVFIVYKIRKGRSHGVALHPVRIKCIFHAMTTYRAKASNSSSNDMDGPKFSTPTNVTIMNDNAPMLPPTYDPVMTQNSSQKNSDEVNEISRSPPNN